MLASDKLIEAFNQQIGNEMGASMQYIAIASYFDSETLPQLARFFYRQSEEEREHAMRFVKFINDVGGRVRIPSLPAPQSDFGSAEDAIAKEGKSYVAVRFLDWFVEEQLEEVTTMNDLLSVIRRAGPDRLLFVEEYLVRQGAQGLESPAAPSSET
jgi:ferritin